MKRYRNLIVVFLDVVILTFTDWLALSFRFDFLFSSIPDRFLDTTAHYLPIQIVVTLVIFFLMRMYQFIWRSVTARDVAHMMIATTVAFLANLGLQLLLFPGVLVGRLHLVIERCTEDDHQQHENDN